MEEKHWICMILLVVGVWAIGCLERNERTYSAPRRPGESVQEWWHGSPTSHLVDCPEGKDPIECEYGYFADDPVDAMVRGFVERYDYIALLDFDYKSNVEHIPMYDGKMTSEPLTRLDVFRIEEEFVNRLPNGRLDGAFVAATCDGNGHCIINMGHYPMPLWSGRNLFLGRRLCVSSKDFPVYVFSDMVFAVEGDFLYDWYGNALDWNAYRTHLRVMGPEAVKLAPITWYGMDCKLPASPRRPEGPADIPEGQPLSDAGPFPLPDP